MSYRQRTKILISTSLLVFISLIGLTVSGNHAASVAAADSEALSEVPPGAVPGKKEKALYRKLQAQLKTAVAAYFKKAVASGEIVGAGVSIVKGDSILFSGGFGKRNAKAGTPVNDRTVFRLGSLSKGFAGILAADLKREGRLSWQDRVRDYLPEFRLGDKDNTDKITLAHLLSHSSGAPYHSYTNLVEAGLPLSEIAGRFREVQPVGPPGAIYSYQNALYALSGEIFEQVGGQPIDAALEERFFKPLEMCSTTMDHQALLATGNYAIPHAKSRKGWRPRPLRDNYYNAIAAGGINSSPLDMARWMRFLLGYCPEVMNRQDIEEAFSPRVEIKGHHKYYHRWPGHESSYYGFGWRIHKFAEDTAGNQKTIWHHGGSVNNFRNEIALFPESDLGICVLFNGYSTLAKTVIPDLYALVQKVYEENKGEMQPNSRMLAHAHP